MSNVIKTGWLNDKSGDKFAPKTLSSQVVTADGSTLESKIENKLNEIQNGIPTKTSQLTNDSGFLTEHQDLSDIKESINRKANEIVAAAMGEQFVVTDSTNEKLRGMKLYGKSEQFTTGGNQLFKYSSSMSDSNSNGINATITESGYIKLDGTSTADFYFNFYTNAQGERFSLNPGTYTISCMNLVNATINGNVVDSNGDKLLTEAIVLTKSNISKTFSINTDGEMFLYICVTPGKIVNETVYVMLNKGTTALPYEPYTGGIPSPNPQYPQEIESSGDDGFVEVEFVGRNIADCSDAESGYPNSTVGDTLLLNQSVASTTYRNCFNVLKDKQYVVTWKSNTPISEAMRVSVITDDSLKVVQTFNVYVKNESVSFIANQDGIVHLCMDNHSTDIQAEYGSSGTSYESYEKQSRVIPTPNGLCGILVTDATVATYIDSDGQMWCCDEIDLEEGTYIERLVCITLDGTENWGQTGNNEYRCSFDNIIPRDNFGGVLCTHYKPAPKNQRNINNTIIRGVYGYQIFICDERFGGDVEAFKAYIASEKVNGTPVKVLCQRVNFVKTKLSTEEIEYYKAIRMGYPNTTITSDAFVKVDYLADTKHYIDNKFAELATALVAIGGI